MARLHVEILVEAVPRQWLEAYVRALLDRAGELSIDEDGWVQGDEDLADVALVEGGHLTAGARYQRHLDPAEGETGNGRTSELLITSWDRTGEVSADVTTWHPDDDKTTWTVRLSQPDTLRSVTAGGAHHAAKRLHRLSWAARLDCRQWWRQAEARRPASRRRAPITVLLRHPYGQGRLWITPSAAGARWRVGVAAAVRGRGWVRPLAAIVLLFARRTLETKFRETIAEIADDWNKDIPGLIALAPSDADLWAPQRERNRSELDHWIEENR